MNCKWISDPADIVIQGCKIKRPFFYLGEAFPIYKKKRLVGEFGRRTRIQYLKDPVINPELPISESNTRKRVVVSYLEMDPSLRCLYLKWMSGENVISKTPESIIAFYLWGISLRVFCDDECKKKEIDLIFKHLKELRLECEGFRWKTKAIVIQKIDLLLSYISIKHYPKRRAAYKEFQHIRQNLVIERIASSRVDKLEDAYDVWFEFFHHEKAIERFSITTLKEWWSIACDEVRNSQRQKSWLPTTLKLNFRDLGTEAGFYPVRNSLDTSILQYSDEAIDFYTQIYKCDIEFHECYRRYRAGYLVRKPSPADSTAKKKREGSLKKTNFSYQQALSKPKEAILSPAQKGAKDLRAKLSSDFQFISIRKIMEDAGYGRPNRQILTSKLKDLYQGFLSEGLGMAPAPSFVSRNYQIDDEVVVFERAVQEKYEPDYLYDFIDVFLKLAAYISQGTITNCERSFILNLIATKDKRVGNQKQLYAYFLWYLRNIRSITNDIKQSINNDLNQKGKEAVAKQLIEYVESDLDTMFTKEHMLANVLPLLTSKQMTISEIKRNEALVTLNLNKLGKIKEDTEVAQSFLSDIFIDNEPVSTPISKDFEYKSILEIILSKQRWDREEINALCKRNGYILGSLLEKLNDYSYSKVDDAIIEDEGNILYVNQEYKDELLCAQ